MFTADSDTTHDVLSQAIDSIKKEATLCQMGTLGLDGIEKLHQYISEKRSDILFLDAPR